MDTSETLRWCRAIRRRPVRAAKVARNIVDRDRLRERCLRSASADAVAGGERQRRVPHIAAGRH